MERPVIAFKRFRWTLSLSGALSAATVVHSETDKLGLTGKLRFWVWKNRSIPQPHAQNRPCWHLVFLNKIQQQNREAAPKKYLSGKILRNILRKYKVSVYVGRTNNVDKAVKQQKNCCLSRVDKPNNNFVFTVFKAN